MNLYDEIAKVAWELYEKSGCIGGRELDNWLEAERIVLTRHASQEMEEPEETEQEIPEEGMAEEERPGPARTESQTEAEGSTVIEEINGQAANVEEDIAPAKVRPAKKVKRAGKPAPRGKKGVPGKGGSKSPRR